MHDLTEKIVNFLNGIGIPVHEGSIPCDSFLPGLHIVDGSLIYDVAALQWPSDLLHEAGHIATMPACMRNQLNDSLDESPQVSHAGEIEATAWAYAAILHLGIASSILFHEGGYHGKSSALVTTYDLGVYPGCYGLAQAGMTLLGADAIQAGIVPYPHMIKWLRD
jgi:hypothetical protein